MDVTSYLLGKNAGGGGGGSLQTKSVTITENGTTTVNPDEGYNGMNKVNITTNVPASGLSDYLNTNINASSEGAQGVLRLFKKIPAITISAIDAQYTFKNCVSLEQIEGITMTGNTTVFAGMFYNCQRLISIPTFDTSHGTTAIYMFYGCSMLTSVPDLDYSNIQQFNDVFDSCSLIESAMNFSTESALNLNSAFRSCSSLKYVPVMDFSNIAGTNTLTNMFYRCNALTDDALNNIMASCITATNYTGTKTLSQLGISNATTYPVSRFEALSNYQAFINAGWIVR